jgi:hypothetical protein
MAWTTPRTWVATETVTASLLNTHLRDNLSDLQTRLTGAGTSFTLTTAGSTSFTVGNATQLNSWRLLQEKFAYFRIHLTLGSTSSVGGTFALGPLPFTIAGTDQVCSLLMKDASAALRYHGVGWIQTTQIFRLVEGHGVSGANATAPFTWTTSDEIIAFGVCEIT